MLPNSKALKTTHNLSPWLWSWRDNAKESVVVAEPDAGWLVRLHTMAPNPVVVLTFGKVRLGLRLAPDPVNVPSHLLGGCSSRCLESHPLTRPWNSQSQVSDEIRFIFQVNYTVMLSLWK